MNKESVQIPNFIMASLLTSYPDDTFAASLDAMLADGALTLPESLRGQVLEIFSSPERIEDLRSSYIDVFDRGRKENPLYETEYGKFRGLNKVNDLADIAGFYKAFGMEFNGEGPQHEMIDHISVQLEFYALLLMKSETLKERNDIEGCEIVLDARKKFLLSHLGRFAGSISSRPGVIANKFFYDIFTWTKEIVDQECEALGVEPESIDWTGEMATSEENVTCGASGNCAV